jgi:Protein of unknown function (DUF2905)
MSRLLIGLGLIIVLIGSPGRLCLGRLPGDIVIERENFRFYFSLATSIILSIIVSAVLWLPILARGGAADPLNWELQDGFFFYPR